MQVNKFLLYRLILYNEISVIEHLRYHTIRLSFFFSPKICLRNSLSPRLWGKETRSLRTCIYLFACYRVNTLGTKNQGRGNKHRKRVTWSLYGRGFLTQHLITYTNKNFGENMSRKLYTSSVTSLYIPVRLISWLP